MRSEIVFRDLPICGHDAHLQMLDLAVAVWRWEDSSPWGATASPVGQPLRDISLKTSLHGRLELRSPDESCPKKYVEISLAQERSLSSARALF